MIQEISLKKIHEPPKPELSQDIDWMCSSLGLVSNRDKAKTSAKIFNMVVDAAIHRKGLTSDMIAEMCQLSRGAVIHHIHGFLNSGVLVKEHRFYVLRYPSLRRTIEEIQKDANRIFDNLKKVADDIDNKAGLEHR